jgi:glycyl-tRNA synthetase
LKGSYNLLNSEKTMEKIVALCKGRGFVYPGSEIYGGLANTWDYGPLGVELKNNVKRAWWKKFVQECPLNVGLDSAILMNPQTWVASGHVGSFSDPLMDCKSCKTRHRADKLIEDAGTNPAGWDFARMKEFIDNEGINCPNCGGHNFTDIRTFNLMFKTFQGVTEDAKNELFLRPETAQGIFVNFSNIQRSSRKKIPFGVAQIGKSFRNEITPGNFTFRTREFEQMELEFFCKPDTDLEWFSYWKDFCKNWLLSLGIRTENLRLRDHEKEELSHYSKATTDFEFLFPFGWGELTSRSTPTIPVKGSTILTPKPTNATPPMSLNPRWAPTVWCLPSFATPMTKRLSMKRIPVSCCGCIRLLRRLKPPCFRFPKSLRPIRKRFMRCLPVIL